MAIPEFADFMLPLLKFVGDGEVHTLSQARDHLTEHFQLTADDQKELLPSGNQTRLHNRVTWARTYLTKAGLLKRAGRGSFQLTPEGKQVLAAPPPRIDKKFLKQFDSFKEFAFSPQPPDQESNVIEDSERTPEEQLEESYLSLRSSLAQDLLERVRKCSPAFFEKLVVDLLVAMGYGGSRADAGQAVGQSGDGGIDGIIKEDKLGLDAVYIQAKRWASAVGRPVVQTFAGSLDGQKARKGVMITTSQFTADARQFVKIIEKRIVLIDGKELAELMIDHGIGVSQVTTYTVRKTDADYFEEDD